MMDNVKAKEMLEFLNNKINEKYKSKFKVAKILGINYPLFLNCTAGYRCFSKKERERLSRLLDLNDTEVAQFENFAIEYQKSKSVSGPKSNAQKYENIFCFGMEDTCFLVKIAPDYMKSLYKIRKRIKEKYGTIFDFGKNTGIKPSVIEKVINGLVLKEKHVQILKKLFDLCAEELQAIENYYYKQKYIMTVVQKCRKIRKEHCESSQDFINRQINEYLHSVGF